MTQQQVGTNHFDRLLDELVLKILYYACRDRSDPTHFHGRHLYNYKYINYLCTTCKRFNFIINKVLLNDTNFGGKIVAFRVGRIREPPFWCDYADCDGCDCREVRKRLEGCKVKFRFLGLGDIHLSRKCMPKFVQDKLATSIG